MRVGKQYNGILIFNVVDIYKKTYTNGKTSKKTKGTIIQTIAFFKNP